MVRSVNFESISDIGLCVRFHFYVLIVLDVLILLLEKHGERHIGGSVESWSTNEEYLNQTVAGIMKSIYVVAYNETK
jgi:hypothetical protein